MGKRNIIKEIEEICAHIKMERKMEKEQMQQFVSKLQILLPEYMLLGIQHGISQESWLEVLTDIMSAMEWGDMVLLVDALEYGLKELIVKSCDMESGRKDN